MANFFKNKVLADIGTTPVELLATTVSTRATIIGLSITNLTASNILATVVVTDDSLVSGHFLKDMLIPAYSTLRAVNGGEKLILAPSNSVTISASQDDSLDVVCSYVEIA